MLTILKIIGICILVILAILLLILLTLLFVPVRYHCAGKLDRDYRQVRAKVSWLASAASAAVDYRDGEFTWTIKVFGIQILPKKKAGKQKARHAGGDEKNSPAGEADAPPNEASGKTEERRTADPDRDSVHPEAENTDESSSEETENAEKDASPSIPERFFREIAHFIRRIRERFQNIREQIVHIRERVEILRERLKNTGKRAESWKKFYDMEETQVTLGVLKAEIKKLIRYLLPTRIRARVHFGFQDPAQTGMTLGAISIVYGFFPKGIDLEPDFEERVLEGEWKLRGRIRLVYFVRLALRLLLKRENRVTYRRLRKQMAG